MAWNLGAYFDSGGLRRSVIDDTIDETAFQLPIIIIVFIGYNCLNCNELNNRHWQFEGIPVLKIHLINKILFLILTIINLELDLDVLGRSSDNLKLVILEPAKIDIAFVNCFLAGGHAGEGEGEFKV